MKANTLKNLIISLREDGIDYATVILPSKEIHICIDEETTVNTNTELLTAEKINGDTAFIDTNSVITIEI